ncbi:MAG TPA: amidohydrolase family protein, partial [Isosphaeraceae bacterium]
MAAVRFSRPLALIGAAAATLGSVWPLASADLRPDYRPAAYAIRGATIVPGAGEPVVGGTVVVRDGVIEAVGPDDRVPAPFDAEVIDGRGLHVYPGFLDLYTTLGVPAGTARSRTGPGRSIPYADFALARTPEDNRNGLTPEFAVAEVLDLPANVAEERRKLGFTDLLAAPGGAIATGQSALVSTGGLPRREAVVRTPVALHVTLRPPFDPPPPPDPNEPPAVARRRSATRPLNYPMSLMGVVAHLRQAMLDAEHHRALRAYYEEKGGSHPSYDPALEALATARTGAIPVWWEANSRDEILRALDLAEEFRTAAVIVGGREAAKVADRLKARGVPVVLRLDFAEMPKVPPEAEYHRRPGEERAEPLRVLAERAARWHERVQTARDLARAGVPFALASDGLAKPETFHAQVRKAIAAGLPPEAAVAALTRDAAAIAGLGKRLGTIEPGKLGHLVALSAPYGDESAQVRYVLADGLKFEPEKPAATKKSGGEPKAKDDTPPNPAPPASAPAPPQPQPQPEPTKPAEPPAAEPAKTQTAPPAAAPPPQEEDQPPKGPLVDLATEFDEDRKPTLHTGGDVLIKDATILTGTGATIPQGSILVRGGKIAAVGPDLGAPEGVIVLDAAGLVAMPGIIDTHSHMAIAGGVNEMSLSIVPEVRVRDVVSGVDPTIYRALAGGTTTARLLHGSANVIGGQDVVIKLRHGQAGRDLIVREGRTHQGVKFALGENVTRRIGRFPNTRMGVEATIERALEEGRAYRDARVAFQRAGEKGRADPPPRQDLRLEALAGIVDGAIKIHSHCYRSDEILMLLRLAERQGLHVQSLQHVLEGYKVAPEIAAHGASTSTFSDWWAYKVEAFDAIPQNAALLTAAGANVCIKSDDEELVRHLNLEAAKMVKYGHVTEAQALAMITLNPARELGLEGRIGSIEVGKDADIALFNAHPFDTFARCELALIDGEVWFQRTRGPWRPAPRPGDHRAMPAPAPEPRDRAVEIAAEAGGVYAIVGATVHPVSAPDIADGTIVIRGGQIVALGGPETSVPPDARTVDARGLDAWPGLVDAGTLLGLFEVGSLQETQDFADSAASQPELRTSTALHADSEVIPVTRSNGVLSAYVQPTGGTIAGQGCVISLHGWIAPEMVLADPVALNVNIPAAPRTDPDAPGRGPTEAGDAARRRRERLEAIREEFRRAVAYDRVATEARARHAPGPPPDPRMAALAPYAKGEKPVIFRADRRAEILDALKLAEELKLRAILTGGAEAWKVAAELKAAGVPVLIGGTLRLPLEPTDPYDAPYANPARLHEAGVRFAIRSGGEGPNQATSGRNLPYEAAFAVAFGLPEPEALKAITLWPAEILGVADRIGSLEVGKRADIVLTAGPILQVTSEVKALFVGGTPATPENRQTRLFAKYRRRLDQVRAGLAPLGLVRAPRPVATDATGP